MPHTISDAHFSRAQNSNLQKQFSVAVAFNRFSQLNLIKEKQQKEPQTERQVGVGNYASMAGNVKLQYFFFLKWETILLALSEKEWLKKAT